jgi:hypothetical protein
MEKTRTLPVKLIQGWRTRTYRLAPGDTLTSPEEAVQFVNERGFVFFWPIKGYEYPSLWAAVAGNRPVADAHDDPGHVTWGWKDGLLSERKWYYGKIVRGKATMIALDTAPYFYALSRDYGQPEEDIRMLYKDGLLSQPAKTIFDTLLSGGPLDTVNLRRKTHMTGKASSTPFERGLVELQRDFKILPVGIAKTGGWRYSFIYDLVHRYYPDLPERARAIQEGEARQHLAKLYFSTLGAATEKDIQRLFQWPSRNIKLTLRKLVKNGEIRTGFQVEGETGEYFAHPDMVDGQPGL